MGAVSEQEPSEVVAEVERLLEEVERLPGGTGRELATGLVTSLLELYGRGLGRIVEEIAARDDGQLAAALVDDELVSHLLLLHGLHPVPLADRVRQALDSVRPYLESHGGNVELLRVEETRVRLALEGSCSGCPSSAMTLKLAIENAIHKAAPEIEEVLADDGREEAEPALLQIELSPNLGPTPNLEPDWKMAGGLKELADAGMIVKEVDRQPILFASVAGRFYGYRPSCPACEHSLADGALDGSELACRHCGKRFDLIRAGRCLDSPNLHLEPVPLLEGEDGLVKVAVAAAA
jgi:Fe-S cluster biogenesis protein NfuA/nitrite reductase/ring-hydroxylating ferredoxin subunit